jgi:hypothetical protein
MHTTLYEGGEYKPENQYNQNKPPQITYMLLYDKINRTVLYNSIMFIILDRGGGWNKRPGMGFPISTEDVCCLHVTY